jgi:hypothetical protein
MTKIEDKSNNTEGITDLVPQNELDDILKDLTNKDPKSKLYKFCSYWLFGYPIKVCANKAGYSEAYGYKIVQRYKKQPKLRQSVDQILNMFPERYRSVCKLRLPQIAEIEGKALQRYEDKPKLAIDKPQLLKQIKQGAGVDLGDIDTPKGPTINIQAMEKVQILISDVLTKRLAESQQADKEE